MSPKTVTFKTQIPNAKYWTDSEQRITNTAELRDSLDMPVTSGSREVKFTPNWIKKEGKSSDEEMVGSGGKYDPANRTITWKITVNEYKQTLNNVIIKDVIPAGLTLDSANTYWQAWDSDTNDWSTTKITPTYTSPDFGVGNINTKILLTITTQVPDADTTTGVTTYTNSANVRWDGVTGNGPGSGGIGVGVGYNAIAKSGVAHPGTRTIHWTVEVNERGQTAILNAKVYDLLIDGPGPVTSANLATYTGIPGGLDRTKLSPKYNQKYNGNFSGTNATSPIVHEIQDAGGNRIGDLLEIARTGTSGDFSFSFDTLITNPSIFAGNGTTNMYNTAALFSGNNWLNEATAEVPYTNNLLRKQLLQRGKNPETEPNASTTDATLGYDYEDNSAIFRLVVNADGLDVADSKDLAGVRGGTTTVTDTLPSGWVFDEIVTGKDYLIFSAAGETASLPALGTVPGLTVNIFKGGNTATFTFTSLKTPYVILVKARPTDETLKNYFKANQTEVNPNNGVTLKTARDPAINRSQPVTIKSQILSKGNPVPTDDAGLKWTVNYRPRGVSISPNLQILDTLSPGLGLRIQSNGELDWSAISITPMILQADGEYVTGTPLLTTDLHNYVSYEYVDDGGKTCARLIIKDLDFTKGYQITYITDVTATTGTVSNKVALSDASVNPGLDAVSFSLASWDGGASMLSNGRLYINKKSGNSNLSGAEFTVFAENKTTVIRKVTTDANGNLMAFLRPGNYWLQETKAPTGYTTEGRLYAVRVYDDGTTIVTFVDDEQVTSSKPLLVQNSAIGTVGRLSIQKTTDGSNTGANEATEFQFTVTLKDAANNPLSGTFPYIVEKSGVPIRAGFVQNGQKLSLKHGELVTISNIPKDTHYTVAEDDYTSDGYITNSDVGGNLGGRDRDGIIEADTNITVAYVNTRNIPGSLSITKDVIGNSTDSTEFEFQVTFFIGGQETIGKTYSYQKGIETGTISSGGTFKHAKGQSILIQGLPEGTTYTVKELNVGQGGYTISNDEQTGTIETGKGSAIAFFNRAPGSLTISKTVAGNAGDVNKKFKFYVTLPAGSYPYSGASSGTYTFNGTNPVEIELAHNETITITGIPDGAAYTVTEADYRNDGYRTSATGTSGTISAGGAYTAAFINTRSYSSSDDDTGSLTIKKTVNGTSGDRERRFTFVVTFSASGRYHYSGSRTGMISSGDKITLAHNEHIEISGLPVGSTYKVTEEEANKGGYHTTSTGASGTISRYGRTADFVNTRGGNPNTGDDQSNDRATFALITFTILLAALFGLDAYLRKKSGKPELK